MLIRPCPSNGCWRRAPAKSAKLAEGVRAASSFHHSDFAIIAATRRTISFFRLPVLVLNGYDIAA